MAKIRSEQQLLVIDLSDPLMEYSALWRQELFQSIQTYSDFATVTKVKSKYDIPEMSNFDTCLLFVDRLEINRDELIAIIEEVDVYGDWLLYNEDEMDKEAIFDFADDLDLAYIYASPKAFMPIEEPSNNYHKELRLFRPYMRVNVRPRPPGEAMRGRVVYLQDDLRDNRTATYIERLDYELNIPFPATFGRTAGCKHGQCYPHNRTHQLDHAAISLIDSPHQDVVPATVAEALEHDSIAVMLSSNPMSHKLLSNKFLEWYGIPLLRPERMTEVITDPVKAAELYDSFLPVQHHKIKAISSVWRWVKVLHILGDVT